MTRSISALLAAVCLAIFFIAPAVAAEPNKYDTEVTIQSDNLHDLQTTLDNLPNNAGDVVIKLEQRLIATTVNVDISVPTDKGITSLTLAHEGDDMVSVYTYAGTETLNFFANGIPLIIDKGVNFGKPTAVYESVDVKVFGGSKDADVEGDTHITINEGGSITGLIFGGGYHGDVTGNTFITAHGGYGGIYGGGYVYPENTGEILSHTADVYGKATIVADNTEEPNKKHEIKINGSIKGGGCISAPAWSHYPNLPENCRLSAQVKGGVSIYANCQVASSQINGGGSIVCMRSGEAGSALNADVTGDVEITLGENMRKAAAFASEQYYLTTVCGGGKINASGDVPSISAQIYGDVKITAIEDAAAAVGEGSIDGIIGGGIVSGEGPNYDATVNGDVSIITSRKAPLIRTGSIEGRLGIVGGGYASYGTADVKGDVNIRICKAPNQAADYQNVKYLTGGGIAGQNGIAQVQGNVRIDVDDDIAFEGGWLQAVFDNEKLGVLGGGWVLGYGGNADVTGTVTVNIGKGASFGDQVRLIGGGRIDNTYKNPQAEGKPVPTAKTGDIFLTLNGTANMVEEIFCGSLEGRAPAAQATVTLKDSNVGFMYDKDSCEKPTTINVLGSSKLCLVELDGKGVDSPQAILKKYTLNIGDGTTPTDVKVDTVNGYGAYLWAPNTNLDIHIFNNAAFRKEIGGTLFYSIRDLTIDEGGTFGIASNEWIYGSLSGSGTLELLAADMRLRMLEKGAVFDGSIKVRAVGAHLNQVVATTEKDGVLGKFVYDTEDFSIQKMLVGDNYDWYLAAPLILPELIAPSAADLYYNGSPQALVVGGSVVGGVLLYSLDGVNYSENVPAATAVDTYTVWYKVQGDDTHKDIEPQTITAAIKKGLQAAPAAPKLESKTADSVTLQAIPPAAGGGAVEYSRDGGASWQSSPVFDGLTPNTAYSFVARYAETESYQASAPSEALQVTTNAGSSSGGHKPIEYQILASAGVGGSISPDGNVSIAEGGSKTFTITPDAGYAVADVLVDGKSVGAARSYTFENIDASHTIEASFKKTTGYADCTKGDTCPILPYHDATPKGWYHDGIHYCLENGLMNGYGNDVFAPNDSLTRGMLAQILYNQAGRPAVSGNSPFADVSPGAWYADAVNWAAGQVVVKGYGNGNFGPEDPIIREQLAVMLWRDTGSLEVAGSLSDYPDANQVSYWAEEGTLWAVEEGILQGEEGHLLAPVNNATRAEAATMLQRFCEDLQ